MHACMHAGCQYTVTLLHSYKSIQYREYSLTEVFLKLVKKVNSPAWIGCWPRNYYIIHSVWPHFEEYFMDSEVSKVKKVSKVKSLYMINNYVVV
jgi:hypothetical protein